MVRAQVFIVGLALLVGLGFFYYSQKKTTSAPAIVGLNDPLPDLSSYNPDQGATWEYVPLLKNRDRISKILEKRRKPNAECPPDAKARTANQWLRWRRTVANKWNEQKEIDIEVFEEIRDCKAQLEALSLWNCFTNVKDFAFQATKPRSRLAFELSDVEYYTKILAYDKKALELPPELKDGIPPTIAAFPGLTGNVLTRSYEGLAKINSLQNWKALKYASRTVFNPNAFGAGSYQRLLFWNTTPRYDKWIQFTISHGGADDPFGNSGPAQQLVDFISVEKTDKNGNRLEKPVLRFAQFNRDADGRNPKPRLDYRTGVGSGDTCYVCHPGGMRQLSPLPGSMGPKQFPVFLEMNKAMTAYGTIDWDGAIHPEYYGPPRGATVGCMDCHNNGHDGHAPSLRRGPINHATAPNHITHKLRADWSMSQARMKGHLAVIAYVKGVDRFTTNNADVNAKLDKVRADLFRGWLPTSNGLDFRAAYQGAKKIAAVAEAAQIPYLPEKLKPDEAAGESMDKFMKDVGEDQDMIERVLFQDNDNRYKIETANWMEMRCPETPVEGNE